MDTGVPENRSGGIAGGKGLTVIDSIVLQAMKVEYISLLIDTSWGTCGSFAASQMTHLVSVCRFAAVSQRRSKSGFAPEITVIFVCSQLLTGVKRVNLTSKRHAGRVGESTMIGSGGCETAIRGFTGEPVRGPTLAFRALSKQTSWPRLVLKPVELGLHLQTSPLILYKSNGCRERPCIPLSAGSK